MLEIGLLPKASGSTGFGRFYPHQGYLGLSPVVVEGTIVARLPPLYPSLPIRQVTVTVRCVATRTIGSDVEVVLWEKAKRLWEPAGSAEYEDIGDWSSPFKSMIPVEAAMEAASAQWTRDLKVVWQLQVAFEHKPIPYVGSRIVKTYLLDIHSYITHPIPPPSPPSAVHTPGAQISLNPPHGAFGPGDPFTISLHVKPDDPSASIRRTTLVIERRTRLIDSSFPDTSDRKDRSFNSWRRSNSPQPYAKLEEAMIHTSKVLEMSTDEAVPGSGGMYWVSLTGTMPKRGGKWEAGETGETKVTMTTFDCRVKVSLKTKTKVKEITCAPVPIILVGSSLAERTAAHSFLSAEAEAHPKASLPKRKHRSSRRGLYMQEGTTDISNPVVVGRDTRPRLRPDRSASPSLPIIIPASDGVKPILLPSNPVPQPQSISFAFPSRPHSKPALPITTLIHPPSPTSASHTPTLPDYSLTDTTFPHPPHPDAYPDMSIIRQFQSSGRRISTSTSEEEEMQPSRSRIKLDDIPHFRPSFHPSNPFADSMSYLPPREVDRPSLPSLDVLGLRLPPVPEYDRAPRRPRTAPAHSAFPSYNGSPGAGGKGTVPLPLSGVTFLVPFDRMVSTRATGMEGARPVTSSAGVRQGREMREQDEGSFAFGLGKE